MRRFPLASLVAVAVLAIPSGAGAATTVGQTFAPTSVCGNTQLQTTSPGGQYLVPSAGVITRWSFQADRAPPQLKFKVARPAPGADLMSDADFTMIGESGLVTPIANTLNSYFVQVAVKPGDVIGLYNGTSGNCERTASGSRVHFHSGDVVPPTTATFTKGGPFLLDLSALLEPDCDSDGLGDETQDKNLSACGLKPLTCKGKFLTIVGTDGPDEIVGTPGPDVIGALDGNDLARGLNGKDTICGDNGKDTLKGGKSNDTLLGRKGRDKLKGGGGGNDVCKGGKGDDSASACEKERGI